VISKESSQLVKGVSVTEGISDHNGIIIKLNIAKQNRPVIKKNFHQYKKLNMDRFQNDILCSTLYSHPSTDVDSLAAQYQHEISRLVSIHAPVITRTVISRTPAPWYTPEIALARQKRRRLERRWRHTKLTVDREIFVAQKLVVNNMLASAKASYYVSLMKNQSENLRQLWATINSLSGHNKPKILPDHANLSSLVNDFNLFFTNKVTEIRDSIAVPDDNYRSVPVDASCTTCMSTFQGVHEADVRKIIKCSPSKSCSLDPIPTRLLKNCEALVPPITNLINLSLSTGRFPQAFKHALVTPLIKNEKLDPSAMNNYRPISNLLYISKLLERSYRSSSTTTYLPIHIMKLTNLHIDQITLLRLLYFMSKMIFLPILIKRKSLCLFFSICQQLLILLTIPSC